MLFQSDREKIYEAYRKVVESQNPHFKVGDLVEDADSVYSIEAIYGYPGEYDTDIERGVMRWVPHGLSWRISGVGSTYPSAERAMEEAESLCSKVSSGESNPYGCTSVNYIRIVRRDEHGGGKHTVSVAVGPMYGKGDFNGLKWIDVSDIAGGERSIDELANDYRSFLSSFNLYGEEPG